MRVPRKKLSPYPPPETIKCLKEEVGYNFAMWSVHASRMNGLIVVPGKYFVLTRDILIYPLGHFLDVGIQGICASVINPSKEVAPFMNFSFLPGGFMDPLTLLHVKGRARISKSKNNAFYCADYLMHVFGKGGKFNKTGQRLVFGYISSGRLPELQMYL